jgi:hypothetical protein
MRREGTIRAASGEVNRDVELVAAAVTAAAAVGAVPFEARAAARCARCHEKWRFARALRCKRGEKP